MHRTLIKLFSFILFVFFASDTLKAQVQDWQWAKSGNGKSAESSVSIVTDTSGNIYVAGFFSSDSIFFGDTLLVSHGNDDIFLVRYNSNGNIEWAKCYGGTGNDYAEALATDKSGNIYMTGYFGSNSIPFGNEILNSEGYDDIFIAKIFPNGNVSWVESFGGSDYEWGLGISCDASDNIYITGFFESDTIAFGNNTFYNAGNDDLFAAKLDNTGNVVWAKSIGGSFSDVGTKIKINSNGIVFLAGYFQSNYLVLGSDTLFNSGGSDPFIAMLNGSGAFQWAYSLKGSDDDFIRSLAVTDNDELFISGSFFSDTLKIGFLSLYNNGDNDIFISRFNALGNPVWSKSIGGTDWDMATGIAFDTFDNVYVCGTFRSASVLFETSTLTNSGASNIFLVKYGFNGSFEWAKKTGGSYSDAASDMATDEAGNIYLTGDYSSGTIVFGSNTLVNSGFSDIYLAKMTSEYNGIPVNPNEDFIFNVFPNPSMGQAEITFSLSAESLVNIEVYNMLGKRFAGIVEAKYFSRGTHFPTYVFPKGIYCITISANGKTASKLLIVQ